MIIKIITFFLLSTIKFYQFFISPILGQNCRYLPTCSEYTIQAIKKFGLIKGTSLSLIEFQNVILGEIMVMIQCQKK